MFSKVIFVVVKQVSELLVLTQTHWYDPPLGRRSIKGHSQVFSRFHAYCPFSIRWLFHGPLTRYVKVRVAHAQGMPGTFSPSPRVSYPDMRHGTYVTHVPWCVPGSLSSGFFWSRWLGKRSRHSWRMRNPQLYISGKRPVHQNGWSVMGNPQLPCVKFCRDTVIVQLRTHLLLALAQGTDFE